MNAGTARSPSMTLLVEEQNVQQALEMADRGYVMENGHTALQGTGTELLANEHPQTHYLGV